MAARAATEDEIRDAIMMVLSTLPQDSEYRFFWRDGRQHLSMRLGGAPEQTLCLIRRPDGVGVPTAVHH